MRALVQERGAHAGEFVGDDALADAGATTDSQVAH